MKIANIIAPIKLLRGSHTDTASTGQGCVMEVIAYLNGEPQIRDQSECVCFVVQPILIWFNDFLSDNERRILIPFIERAMGSATKDRTVIAYRARLVADTARRMSIAAAKFAKAAKATKLAKSAKSAAKFAAKFAAKAAKFAAKAAAESDAEYVEYAAKAAKLAKSAANYAESAKFAAEYAKSVEYAEFAAEYAAGYADSGAIREEIKSACLGFLDRALPQHEHGPVVIERAIRLRELITA